MNKPDHFLQIIVCSSEGPEKSYPLVRTLHDELGDQTCILVLCTQQSAHKIPDFGPSVKFKTFPGKSAIDMRAQMSVEANSAEWVVVLEDHINVDADWLRRLREDLAGLPTDVTCLIGSAANLTSKEKWSWANFLNVQAYHWHPCLIEPLKPIGFNFAIRRKLLPNVVLQPGEVEVMYFHQFMSRPAGSVNFPADHVQVRYLLEVIYYHFCNGRVSGAAIQKFHPNGFRHVMRHAFYNAGGRRREVKDIIRKHPLYSELPAGTCLRVAILAFSHSAGAILGGLIGPGRAAWALE